VRQDRYRKHITRVHQGAAPLSNSETSSFNGVVAGAPRALAGKLARTDAKPKADMHSEAGGVDRFASRNDMKQCPFCPSKVRGDRYGRHIGRVHQASATLPAPLPHTTDELFLNSVDDDSTKIDIHRQEDRRIECDCGGEPACVMCEGSGWFIEHYDGDFTPGSSL